MTISEIIKGYIILKPEITALSFEKMAAFAKRRHEIFHTGESYSRVFRMMVESGKIQPREILKKKADNGYRYKCWVF